MITSIEQEGDLTVIAQGGTRTFQFVSDDPKSPMTFVLSTNYMDSKNDLTSLMKRGRVKITVETDLL